MLGELIAIPTIPVKSRVQTQLFNITFMVLSNKYLEYINTWCSIFGKIYPKHFQEEKIPDIKYNS